MNYAHERSMDWRTGWVCLHCDRTIEVGCMEDDCPARLRAEVDRLRLLLVPLHDDEVEQAPPVALVIAVLVEPDVLTEAEASQIKSINGVVAHRTRMVYVDEDETRWGLCWLNLSNIDSVPSSTRAFIAADYLQEPK